MAQLVVNISEMAVSKKPADVLVTYSLGSCLGVTVWDPELRAGGLIHCLLPMSKLSPDKAQTNPDMFVNTGVARLVKTLLRMGAEKERLVIKAAGGGKMMGLNDLFNVGARNLTSLLKLLDVNGLKLAAMNVGQSVPRTMYLHIDSGEVLVKSLRVVTAL